MNTYFDPNFSHLQARASYINYSLIVILMFLVIYWRQDDHILVETCRHVILINKNRYTVVFVVCTHL
jgi:hypothetical protein